MRIGFIIAITIFLDQTSKWIVRETMVLHDSINVIGKVLKITFVENRGIAFGIAVANPVFYTILSTIASVSIAVYLFLHRKDGKILPVSLSLILGGAFGNLIDRILFQKVVDFIDMGFGNLRWPVYNIADSAVVIGMCILLVHVVKQEKQLKKEQAEKDSHPG